MIGANGCGKTTLLKTVLGLLPARRGAVRAGRPGCTLSDVAGLEPAERARVFAYVPQAHTPPFPYTVADVVMLGRMSRLAGRGPLATPSEHDRRVAWESMESVGIESFATDVYTHLSGGQRQLVLIARALCQEPSVIVMDEPAASLDFGNQQQLLAVMKRLASEGLSVLMVTHDPQHAFKCATRVIAMDRGGVIADGDPASVMTTELLASVYGCPLEVVDVRTSAGSTRLCIPL